ncbi:unnamed protein product [Protopolystoma xenopodis]|uniref:Uncharacterized protein n=1 Tax=Protopolystoma xenopodis TaxID=117903 RepID=A0A3S5BAM3_9PLAT|nr:unnamed protein product [Protopolystoma xenopodis]
MPHRGWTRGSSATVAVCKRQIVASTGRLVDIFVESRTQLRRPAYAQPRRLGKQESCCRLVSAFEMKRENRIVSIVAEAWQATFAHFESLASVWWTIAKHQRPEGRCHLPHKPLSPHQVDMSSFGTPDSCTLGQWLWLWRQFSRQLCTSHSCKPGFAGVSMEENHTFLSFTPSHHITPCLQNGTDGVGTHAIGPTKHETYTALTVHASVSKSGYGTRLFVKKAVVSASPRAHRHHRRDSKPGRLHQSVFQPGACVVGRIVILKVYPRQHFSAQLDKAEPRLQAKWGEVKSGNFCMCVCVCVRLGFCKSALGAHEDLAPA